MFQSWGITSFFHMSLQILWSMFGARYGFAFRASDGMLSGPEALAVINFLIACLISVFDGRLRFIFSSSSALLIAGVTSGGGLFSSSLKCSAHLASCSSVVVRTFPCLYLICWLVCLRLPASFLVVSYRSFIIPHVCSFFCLSSKIFYVCSPVFSYTLSNFLVSFVVFCLSCCLFFPSSATINCTFLLHFFIVGMKIESGYDFNQTATKGFFTCVMYHVFYCV